MKQIIIIIVIVFLGVAGYFLLQDSNQSDISDQDANNAAGTMPAGTQAGTSSDLIGEDAVAPIREPNEMSYSVVYDAENGFSPATLNAQAGDIVDLNFRTASGTTNLLIDELGVMTPVMTPDSGDITESFVAENAGTYRFYGMWNDELTAEGELIVE